MTEESKWVVTINTKPPKNGQVRVPVVRRLIKEKKNALIVEPFSKTITGMLRLLKVDHLYKIFDSQLEAFMFYDQSLDKAIEAYNAAEGEFNAAAARLNVEVERFAGSREWDND